MIKITYFVHGTTTDNEKNISSGWADVELSELGIKQSIDLKEQTKDKHFDVVFCSDLKRAIKSAELTWQNVYEIIQDKRLRECNYGDYNAKPSEIVEPMQEKMTTDRFPNGESYEDVKVRIKDFLQLLKENYDGKSVAIVAHKAPQLALDVLFSFAKYPATCCGDEGDKENNPSEAMPLAERRRVFDFGRIPLKIPCGLPHGALLKGKTWEQAFAEDWRKTRSWQAGWEYELK